MRWLVDRDVLAGAIFIAIGLFFAATSLTYKVGTPANMGPGLFPLALGTALAGLGLGVVLKALRKHIPDTLERFKPRAALLILAAVALFGLALEPLGLPVTVAVLVLVALLGAGPIHWPSALMTAVGLAGLCVLIFVVGLAMPIPLLPWPLQ